jgi:hypothetical protein
MKGHAFLNRPNQRALFHTLVKLQQCLQKGIPYGNQEIVRQVKKYSGGGLTCKPPASTCSFYLSTQWGEKMRTSWSGLIRHVH